MVDQLECVNKWRVSSSHFPPPPGIIWTKMICTLIETWFQVLPVLHQIGDVHDRHAKALHDLELFGIVIKGLNASNAVGRVPIDQLREILELEMIRDSHIVLTTLSG